MHHGEADFSREEHLQCSSIPNLPPVPSPECICLSFTARPLLFFAVPLRPLLLQPLDVVERLLQLIREPLVGGLEPKHLGSSRVS